MAKIKVGKDNEVSLADENDRLFKGSPIRSLK
jgi:hypothetical protein